MGRPYGCAEAADPTTQEVLLVARQKCDALAVPRAELLLLLASAACSLEASVGGQPGPFSSDPLTGARPSSLACDPSDFDLGDSPPGVPAEREVRCAVGAGGGIELTGIAQLDGSDPGFGLAPADGARLPVAAPGGGELALRLTHTGEGSGMARATFRLVTSTGASSEFTARAGVDGRAACRLRLEPSSLDFGAAPLDRPASAFFRLINEPDAPGPCSVGGFALLPGSHPGFRVRHGPLSLRPGQAQVVPVELVANDEGELSGTLGVFGERDVLLQALPLWGSTLFPGAGRRVEPIDLDFGLRPPACENPAEQAILLEAGAAPLEFQAELVAGADPSFHFEPRSGVVPAGGRLRLPVRFLPVGPGQRLGRLRVLLGPSRVFVSLRGEGTDDPFNEQRFVGAGPYPLVGRPVFGSVQLWLDREEIPDHRDGRPQWGVDYVRSELRFATAIAGPRTEALVRYENVCTPSTCGNGVLDRFEQCDDGNDDDHDGCLSDCRVAHCGDGFLRRDSKEECDDGNTLSGDGCNAFCGLEWCGNHVVEPPEQCDTGSARSDVVPDACRTNCQAAHCGDGVVDRGEACDDGNDDPGDACVHCEHAFCGDGFVFRGVEECDDGNDVPRDGCEPNCAFSRYSHSVLGTPDFPDWSWGVSIRTTSPIALPFEFRFLGAPTRQVDASEVGRLRFGSGRLDWWRGDLTGGSVRAFMYGFTGDRVFVLRWRGLTRASDPELSLSAEVRLHERNGSVVVHYGPIDPASAAGGAASVGWASASEEIGLDPLGCSPGCSLSSWPAEELHRYRL